MDTQTKLNLLGLCPSKSPVGETGYLQCCKEKDTHPCPHHAEGKRCAFPDWTHEVMCFGKNPCQITIHYKE